MRRFYPQFTSSIDQKEIIKDFWGAVEKNFLSLKDLLKLAEDAATSGDCLMQTHIKNS